jgi:hypothetical protein
MSLDYEIYNLGDVKLQRGASDAAPSEAADDDKANAPERVRHELRRPSPRQSD